MQCEQYDHGDDAEAPDPATIAMPKGQHDRRMEVMDFSAEHAGADLEGLCAEVVLVVLLVISVAAAGLEQHPDDPQDEKDEQPSTEFDAHKERSFL